MSRIFKFTILPLAAIALALTVDTKQSDAGGFSLRIGNGTYGRYSYRSHSPYHGAYRYGRTYVPSYRIPQRSYHHGGYRHPRGPHYDWHRPSLVPHGNHYDYVPGHFDFHHRGHFHH